MHIKIMIYCDSNKPEILALAKLASQKDNREKTGDQQGNSRQNWNRRNIEVEGTARQLRRNTRESGVIQETAFGNITSKEPKVFGPDAVSFRIGSPACAIRTTNGAETGSCTLAGT